MLKQLSNNRRSKIYSEESTIFAWYVFELEVYFVVKHKYNLLVKHCYADLQICAKVKNTSYQEAFIIDERRNVYVESELSLIQVI